MQKYVLKNVEQTKNLSSLHSFKTLSSLNGVRGFIVGFHSRDQQPCFSTKTKENVCIIIEFNSQRIGSGHK